MVFREDDSRISGWLKYTLLGLVGLAIAAAIVWLWIAVLGRRIKAALGTPKLNAVMSVLFVCLSIPVLIFILLYNYRTNAVSIASMLRENVAKTTQASIENTENFIQPIAGALRLLAAAAANDPGFFRTEQSRDFLYRTLTAAPQIDAAYVSFEDGYHRVVTRVDDDRRRSDPLIPLTANWHSSYIDDFSAGEKRARHRTLFRHLATRRWPIQCSVEIGYQNFGRVCGSKGIQIAGDHRDDGQSGHGVPDYFFEISDRTQRRIYWLLQRQYHLGHPVSLSAALPHQREQYDDYRGS